MASQKRIFVQCFDPGTLRAVRARVGDPLPLIQLVGSKMRVDTGTLRDIASYANGIGPSLKHLYQGRDEDGRPALTDLVERAHHLGLLVHPYTHREDDLPDGIESGDELLGILFDRLGADGVFTDFTNLARDYADKDRP